MFMGRHCDARNVAQAVYRQTIRIRNLRLFFDEAQALNLYEHLLESGKTEQDIRSALDTIKERHGIVLAIRRSAMDTLQLANGDHEHGDLRVYCPDGLGIEHIAGIEPMGDYEYDELDKLSESE